MLDHLIEEKDPIQDKWKVEKTESQIKGSELQLHPLALESINPCYTHTMAQFMVTLNLCP